MLEEAECVRLKTFADTAALLGQKCDKEARECVKEYSKSNNSSEYCVSLASTIKKFVLGTIELSDKFKNAIDDKRQFCRAIEILEQIPQLPKLIHNDSPNIKQSTIFAPMEQSLVIKTSPPSVGSQASTQKLYASPDESDEEFNVENQSVSNTEPLPKSDSDLENGATSKSGKTDPQLHSHSNSDNVTTSSKPARTYASPDESDEEMAPTSDDVATTSANDGDASSLATPSLDSDATIACAALSDVDATSESMVFDVATTPERRSLSSNKELSESEQKSQLPDSQKKSLLKVISDYYAKKQAISSSSEEEIIIKRSPRKRRIRTIISSDSDDSDHSGGNSDAEKADILEDSEPKASNVNIEDPDTQNEIPENPSKTSEPNLESNKSSSSESNLVETEPFPQEIPDSLPGSEEDDFSKKTEQFDSNLKDAPTSPRSLEGSESKKVETACGSQQEPNSVDAQCNLETSEQENPSSEPEELAPDSSNQDSEVDLSKKPKPDQSEQFQLDSQARDELLDMFKENEQRKFQLSDGDRDELLNLLSAHATENFGEGKCDRDQMAELVKEFEVQSQSSGSHSRASELLDVVLEETYYEDKDASLAWDRYHKLLNASDTSDCASTDTDTSSSSISLMDVNERKRVRKKRYTALCRKNGITKELIVKVTPIDITSYDLPSTDTCDPDNLFNLATLKRKARQSNTPDSQSDSGSFPPRRRRRKCSSLTFSSDDDGAKASYGSVYNNLSDVDERERLANEMLDKMQDSSDELGNSSSSDVSLFSDEDKPKYKRTKKSEKEKDQNDSSDEEGEDVGVTKKKKKGAWRNDPLLKEGSSSLDESDDSIKPKRKHKFLLSDDSDDDVNKHNGHSDDDSEASDYKPSRSDSDCEGAEKRPKTPDNVVVIGTDDDDSPSKKGKGRRNIRSLLEDDDLSEATQQAKNAEKERIKRLEERVKEKSHFSQPIQSVDCEPLILDASGDHQISIHPKIVKKLKPHQRDGIQFMWDSCYESIKQCENSYKGSGCILAHCMGLGKTLQALALIQALFTHEFTKTKHVLVVCPLSTVSNWKNEVKLAFQDINNPGVKTYTIVNKKDVSTRFDIVHKWAKRGGLLIMGYECFGLLINEKRWEKWGESEDKEKILRALVDPGPDLVICDEGHLLRNKQTQRTIALNRVKTMKRIVLTGTPLQNNLLEYYYMVHFVKPNLLGTEKEFKTNFVNPIQNGQFEDSTSEDIMFMKKRSHILHTVLKGTVQRVEDSELKRYLPKLVDQAIFVTLTNLQVDLYNKYLEWTESKPQVYTKTGDISRKNFLADVQMFRYICLHPDVVITAEKNSRSKIKEQDVIEDYAIEEGAVSKGGLFKGLLKEGGCKKLEEGSKLSVAIALVEEAAKIGDKTLIFAQSYAEMDNLEFFLSAQLNYKKNREYYRMDGTISPEVRTEMCDRFNKDSSNLKVFIMSTKVGGLGLNLTAANRVIIMNVNWNPSYDIQSVFRAFRFGQTKAVYVYRLIAKDTMEEKMYQRVVTKLAIAHRVVDKHQITRHYSAADIQEFYSIRPVANISRALPMLPEDNILAKLIKKYDIVFKWHEHQSLLANRPEEDLDEQEKNAAWEEYNRKEQEPFHVPMVPYVPNMPGPSDVTHRMRTFGFRTPTLSGLQNITAPPSEHNYSTQKPPPLQQRINSLDDFRPQPRPPVPVIKPTFQSTFRNSIQSNIVNPMNLQNRTNSNTVKNSLNTSRSNINRLPKVWNPNNGARYPNPQNKVNQMRGPNLNRPVQISGTVSRTNKVFPKLVQAGGLTPNRTKNQVQDVSSNYAVTIRRSPKPLASTPINSTVTVRPVASRQTRPADVLRGNFLQNGRAKRKFDLPNVSVEQLAKKRTPSQPNVPPTSVASNQCSPITVQTRNLYEHLHKLQAQSKSKQKLSFDGGQNIATGADTNGAPIIKEMAERFNRVIQSKGPIVKKYGSVLPRTHSSSIHFQDDRKEKENLGKRKLTSQETLEALPNRGITVKLIKNS